jgi:hypothetical protein
MEGTCNYCRLPVVHVEVVVAIERMSGPPYIRVACSTCMTREGMKPWESPMEILLLRASSRCMSTATGTRTASSTA